MEYMESELLLINQEYKFQRNSAFFNPAFFFPFPLASSTVTSSLKETNCTVTEMYLSISEVLESTYCVFLSFHTDSRLPSFKPFVKILEFYIFVASSFGTLKMKILICIVVQLFSYIQKKNFFKKIFVLLFRKDLFPENTSDQND